MTGKRRKVAAPAEAAPEPAVAVPVVAYKGFDANLQCRGFQYAIGETFNLVQIRAAMVGEQGIKPNVFYTLDEAGELAEWQP